MPWNSHIVIDDEGNTAALYNKLHLFDLEIPGKVRLMESEFSKRGTRVCRMFQFYLINYYYYLLD